MNTRIERDFVFDSAIHFANGFYINSYALTLSMLIETESIREQNIALDRLTHFMSVVLNSSIFVEQNDTKVIKKYKDAGIRVCTLPEEPYDQIVALVLLVKLNAIAEGRLKITDLTLSSNLSDGVRFCTVAEEAENFVETGRTDLWWNVPTLCVEHCQKKEDDNIVKLFGQTGWAEHGLEWKEKTTQSN